MLFFSKIRIPTRVSVINSFDKVIAKISDAHLFADIIFLQIQNAIDNLTFCVTQKSFHLFRPVTISQFFMTRTSVQFKATSYNIRI